MPSTTHTPTAAGTPAPTAGVPAGGRDRYLDTWRAAALVRVVTYHVFGWIWLTVLFPAMGLMFATAGSLMASSLDRAGPVAVRRRLRRLLPPLWAYAAVTVPLLLTTGWGPAPSAALGWGELAWWVLPARTPPVGGQPWAWAHNVVLWYIVTYLWLVALSPALLAVFRRWPWPSLAVATALPVAFLLDVVRVEGYFSEQATNVATYLACWMVGFAHRDGLLRRVPARRYACLVALLAVGGGAWVLASAYTAGSFDLNRIPGGNTLWSLAFVATVLRFRPRMAVLDRLPPVRRLVEVLNARAVTVYLWHLPLAAAVGMLVPALLRAGTPGQILLRLAAVWVLTGLAVVLFGWVEDLAARRPAALLPPGSPTVTTVTAGPVRPAPRPAGSRWHPVMVATVAVVALGLAGAARYGSPVAATHSQERQPQHAATHYLSDLLLVVGRASVPGSAAGGPDAEPGTVTLDGVVYQHAVVAPAPSRLRVRPPAGCRRLQAVVGTGEHTGEGSLGFLVRVDGVTVYDSGPRSAGDGGRPVDVDVTAATSVDLVTTGRPAGVSAVWADARFDCD